VTTASELRDRWYQPDGLKAVLAVRSWLAGRGPRPDGLGEVKGRVDLRSFPLTGSTIAFGDPDDPDAGVVWHSLDLSNARGDALRLFGARIDNCVFDGASLVDLRLWGGEVTDCSFRRADLQTSILGAGDWHGSRTTWRRVTFDRAKLRRSVFKGCVLDGCTFERPGKLLQIIDCEVNGCTFRGDLDSAIISGRGYAYPVTPSAFSADFSQAVFHDSHIDGYLLDNVTFPDQANLVLVRRYPSVFRKAAVWLAQQAATEPDPSAVRFLQSWTKAAGSEESDLCFDLDAGDPVLEAVRRALDHVQGT